MLISYKLTQTSIILRIKIPDSTKSDNSGVAGLTNTTTGLQISTIADNEATAIVYSSASSTVQTITTLGTFSAPSTSNCRFKEVDSVNHKGVYELQIADARYAVSSAKSLLITIAAITTSNVSQIDVLIPLTAFDPYTVASSSANTVRTGTIQSGNVNTVKLDSGASSTSEIYDGLLIQITGGTGVGQVRTILTYNGSSKQAAVDRPFITAPNSTSTFSLLPTDNPALNANLQVTASVPSTIIRTGTAQSGSTSTTIKLDSGASATNNIYVGDLITIINGTGLGQSRTIIAYVGSTKVATVDRTWNTTPDNTSVFDIFASTAPSPFSNQGVAQSATSTTITLQSTASTTDSIYNGSIITIISGTDAGDTAEITGYVGSTKVATISGTWAVTPDTTSSYAVIPSAGSSPPSTLPTFPANFSALAIDTSGHLILQPTGLDSITAWSGVTVRQAIFYAAAGIVGQISGLPTSPATIKGLDGTTTAAVISFDTNNNRTSSVLTPP